MTYTPSHVANFMLDRAKEEERYLSPMKLLKLVYIGYGWALALLGEKLFEERICAWDHGPVVRSLYHEFKHYGKRAILEASIDFDLDDGSVVVPRIPSGDERTNVVLNKVWDIYKHFSAWDLRNKTHEAGTPWTETYNKGVRNASIPDELIKAHFEQKIGQYLQHARQRAEA